jgi:hypothetical protein
LIIQRFLRHCPVRAGAVFQALLTAIGGGVAADREPHPEAALLTKASFLKRMREQFPTLETVAVPSSGGVAFRIVMAMK